MDPRHSNVGEGSQGFQPIAPNVPMMNPSSYAPEGFQPAEIPEASNHNSEAGVEEVAAPTARTGKRKNKNSGTRIKLGNFNADEDVNLVKSWLEMSCDPITSTGQKRDRMWERIITRYNSRRASNPERSVRSLQSRWDKINAEVSLFASVYADSIRENPSGMSDACKTTHAVGNFASVHKQKFGFLHCWKLMKDEPKWQDPNVTDIATAAQGEGFRDESTQGPDTVDNAEGRSSPVRSGAQARRPMGRDSAKAAKKKANSDAGSTSSAEMDPRHSNVGEGSQGFQPIAPNVPMMNPSSYAPEGFQPAEIPEASNHNSEAGVEEVAAPTARTGKRKNKNSGTRIKLGNFNADEDVNLVKSWLEISCDPITSTGQKRDRMWERIITRYNSRRASNPERSVRSLQSRWDKINAEVSLFASVYADSIRENPSGMSDACKTTHAVGNFASVHKRKFGFLHCWKLMKDEPKWQDPNVTDIATAAQGEGFRDESTQGPDTVDNAEGRSSPVRSGAQARRPMGRDSAKAAKKKANSDAGSTSSAEMDPRHSNVGEGSQGFQPIAPNVPMMNPSGYAPEGFQPAEIPEASNHNSEAGVEEVAAPTARTGKRKNKNSGTRIKLGNFNADEDVNLVKSWLEISCDPITSTGQKRDRMWERIITRYNSRRASNPERSVRSLQSRWDKINAEVSLFASVYADSIRENPSGMSDACKTTHAVGNFASVHKRKFGFLHCWKLMKDEPKWQDPNVTDIATAAQGEGFGDKSTQWPDTMDNAEGRSSPVRSGAQARRPMGRDSAKAAKKKANSDAGSTSSAEYAARMQDLSLQKIAIMQEEAVRKNDRFQQLASIDERRFEEMRRINESLIQIEQEKIRLMREKQEDERLKEEKKEDERILKVDLDACKPSLRLYYQTLQEEILEKIAARRRRSQAL